jgi:YVTN family beta-propeller protein
MYSSNSNRSGAAWTRGFMALFAIMLAMAISTMAPPAAAAPFAYVTNGGDGTATVIDTATNTVVGLPIPVGREPFGVAVTPDGKHAYVANRGSNNVSVIDTATNTVEPTVIMVGTNPVKVAVTPDGKHAYVTNFSSNNVSVIDMASNTVAATVAVGNNPRGVAVTPDGKHGLVSNSEGDPDEDGGRTIGVIDLADDSLAYANGGHFPWAILCDDGGCRYLEAVGWKGTLVRRVGHRLGAERLLAVRRHGRRWRQFLDRRGGVPRSVPKFMRRPTPKRRASLSRRQALAGPGGAHRGLHQRH